MVHFMRFGKYTFQWLALFAIYSLSSFSFSALFPTMNEIDILLGDGQKVLILLVNMDERALSPKIYEEHDSRQGKPVYQQVTEGIIGQQRSLLENYMGKENVHFIDAHIGRFKGAGQKMPGGLLFGELINYHHQF